MKTTEFNYNGFEITIRKERRNSFGGRQKIQDRDKFGTTEVKIFTIKFKGEEREEEFKSIPECKRFIDKGGLNYWIKIIS